jgi:crossover junction endodeoxyribonuclease RuvC
LRTVGLDIATHTGVALVEDGWVLRGKVVQFPKERGLPRLHLIAAEVERTIEMWNPDLVAIEGYAFARNVASFVTLVECGTYIKQVLYRRKLPWIEVPPTTLKKWTTGKGTSNKEAMAKAVKDRWDYTSPHHDVVDAVALAQLAQLGLAGVSGLVGVEVFVP